MRSQKTCPMRVMAKKMKMGMRMEMGRTLFLRKLTKRQRKQAEKQNGLSPC